MRFGNKSFRVWLEKVVASSSQDLKALSPLEGFEKAIPEL
jgi:hypothetical protein